MIHAPSLGIGAGIAAAVIIGALFVMNGQFLQTGFKTEDIKEVEPDTQIQAKPPEQIQMSVFSANSSQIGRAHV